MKLAIAFLALVGALYGATASAERILTGPTPDPFVVKVDVKSE